MSLGKGELEALDQVVAEVAGRANAINPVVAWTAVAREVVRAAVQAAGRTAICRTDTGLDVSTLTPEEVLEKLGSDVSIDRLLELRKTLADSLRP